MNIIKPKKIEKGDNIGFIAPAGFVIEDDIVNAKNYLENLGYNVVFSENLFECDRYMAGTDEERLNDLHWAFENKDIDAIFCVRGGYGALRLVNKIDYDLIKNNPKIFCGYSDISLLSAMIYKKTGLITFSSPMPKGDFQPENINDFTVENLFNVLQGNTDKILPDNVKVYQNGVAKGVMFGGNLSTIASVCGLDFLPDDDFLFFAEDLAEPVYKIDRYFHQLLNIDKFRQNCKAILLGDFLDIEYPDQLDTLFFEFANELNIPVIGGYNFSHSKKKCTVPYGAKALLEDCIIHFESFLE